MVFRPPTVALLVLDFVQRPFVILPNRRFGQVVFFGKIRDHVNDLSFGSFDRGDQIVSAAAQCVFVLIHDQSFGSSVPYCGDKPWFGDASAGAS